MHELRIERIQLINASRSMLLASMFSRSLFLLTDAVAELYKEHFQGQSHFSLAPGRQSIKISKAHIRTEAEEVEETVDKYGGMENCRCQLTGQKIKCHNHKSRNDQQAGTTRECGSILLIATERWGQIEINRWLAQRCFLAGFLFFGRHLSIGFDYFGAINKRCQVLLVHACTDCGSSNRGNSFSGIHVINSHRRRECISETGRRDDSQSRR